MLNLPTNSFWMFSGTWYTCGTVTAGSGHQDLKSDVTWFDEWYPETQVLMDEQPLQTLAQMSTLGYPTVFPPVSDPFEFAWECYNRLADRGCQ